MSDYLTISIEGMGVYACTPLPANGALKPVIGYAQQDVRWKADRMGGTPQTVGGYGCAMVCACMIYTQVDQGMTPDVFNDILSSEGGYNIIYGAEAHLAWERLPSILSRFQWLGRKSWYRLLDSQELADVKAMIREAPLPLWVDFRPATSKLDSHFVLAVDYDESDVEIIDPWEGVRSGLLQRYGNAGDTLHKAIWGYRRLIVE
jgi:hypothetical protein